MVTPAGNCRDSTGRRRCIGASVRITSNAQVPVGAPPAGQASANVPAPGDRGRREHRDCRSGARAHELRAGTPRTSRFARTLPEIPIVIRPLLSPDSRQVGPRCFGCESGLTEDDLRNFRRGSFRMSRYDWYLVASVESEIPMPLVLSLFTNRRAYRRPEPFPGAEREAARLIDLLRPN